MTDTRLARKLTLFDAVIIGLAAMIGAGIFAVIAPSTQAAGSAVLIALVLAGLIAYCNACSSAQLAAVHPQSGGSYVYGRERLGELWGFLAGWAFLVGKVASCAAMALTFGHYLAPEYARLFAVGAVVALTVANYFGVKKTAALSSVIVVLVVGALLSAFLSMILSEDAEWSRLKIDSGWEWRGLLQAAGLWFFAFAGYARLATLGEEVIAPQKVIPKAIPLALGLVLLLYFMIAVGTLVVLDLEQLSNSTAPLADAVAASTYPWLTPVIRVAAAIACLGVLLSLVAGISRTLFAMAANRDMPSFFAAVHSRYKIPHRAELTVGIAVASLVLFLDLRNAIGFSAFTILFYYTIANASALRLSAGERRWPRAISVIGLLGCLTLAFSLPPVSVLAGTSVFIAGSLFYVFIRPRFRP